MASPPGKVPGSHPLILLQEAPCPLKYLPNITPFSHWSVCFKKLPVLPRRSDLSWAFTSFVHSDVQHYLLICGSVGSSLHVGFSLVAVSRFLIAVAPLAAEHRLSSCGTRAQLLLGTWDLPRPGIKPMSPTLAGRFLSTMPPGMALANF